MRNFLLLVILEADKHGEAVEHVGVEETVDIEGEQEGGPSSGSSTGINAPTRGENMPPRSLTRRTSRPESPTRDVPQGSEYGERRGLNALQFRKGWRRGHGIRFAIKEKKK